MEQQNILIVGGGVAGITVAMELTIRGHSITLLDNSKNHCSVIAAGLINPIVFRRMAKSWRVDEFLPFALDFYRALEKKVGCSLIEPIQIRRMFSSIQERNYWMEKQTEQSYSAYLNEITEEDWNYSLARNDFGSGRLKQAYAVSTANFIQESLKQIQKEHKLVNETFDFSALDPVNAVYKGMQYDHIIFCEGVGIKRNPYFSALKVTSTQGEILTIHSDSLPENESLNRKCFVLPLGNQMFRVGSTYKWDIENPDPTQEGLNEISEMLSYLMTPTQNFEIREHIGGVRPTSVDRRPFLGKHSNFPKLAVFNGLGTKGYLLAPLLAKELIDYLLQDKPLSKEVSINR
jgi:glycine/D-amino acid oxidase-like deaminating enzyme